MPAVERTFADYLRRADRVAYLAELDGTAVGVLVGELRRPFYLLRPQLWISDLIITEHARGQGIGSRLLAAALSDAAAAEAYGASVTAPASRPAAGRLLQAAGFSDVGSSFVLER
jgi:GNAT superfamily N-acetyltransferase